MRDRCGFSTRRARTCRRPRQVS